MAPNNTSEKDVNPNEYLHIPKWINEDFFKTIVEKDIPNFSRILCFTPRAATSPGENYNSVMVRVAMDVELNDGSITQMSYILKTGLDAGSEVSALASSMNLFPKEMKMYQTILPIYEKLYKEAGVNVQIGPKCLQINEMPETITLVLEDLHRKQFGNIDRLQGFDMPHITAVLHKLAEVHAASTVYYEMNGDYDSMYQDSFFTEANRPFFIGMVQTRHNLYQKAMRQWGLENVEYYIAKLASPDRSLDEGIRLNNVDPDEFNVLNHGDCWVNNIMFTHDENGEISETIFVDFQLGKWGSPAYDLWYMILTSASADIRVREFDHFIQIYHKRLVECLKLLKYTKAIPSLKNLHAMMIKYGYWGILTTIGTMSIVLLPSDKDANMDNMLKSGPESEEFHLKTFTNPYYTKAMLQLYPFFEYKGILDME